MPAPFVKQYYQRFDHERTGVLRLMVLFVGLLFFYGGWAEIAGCGLPSGLSGTARPSLRDGRDTIEYVPIRYTERLREAGIEPSVGSVGDSYDNALAETINGVYKAEVIYRRPWPTRQSVEKASLEWVDWFNHRRLFAPIGNIPPAEAEARYYQQLAGARRAA